jgi:ATP-binding cassette, subfamily B, multidrug efflux pump
MKSLLRLKPYLLKYKRTLLIGFIAVIISNVFSVFQPILQGHAIDALKHGIETGSVNVLTLLGYAGLILGFALLAGFFMYLTRQTIIVTSWKIQYDLRNDFLSHIQRLDLHYFQNTPTGDLMAHATNDISAVRNVVGPGIMYPLDTLMTFAMVLVVILSLDWKLTLIALTPLPLVSYAVYKLGKSVHKRFEERQAQYSALTTRAQENLSGIRIVKSYVREAYETGLFHTMSWSYLKKNMELAIVQSLMWPLMFLLIGVSLLLTLYFGGMNVIKGEFTIGTLWAFLGYLTQLIWPMIAFGWVTNMLQQGAASMTRLAKIFDTEPAIKDTQTTDTTIHTIEGSIEFRGVSFRHSPSTEPTLKNINLTISKGMTLAVIGTTGSGKTTLVNMIPRLYDVTEGEILIDGMSITSIPLDVLRSHIGYVQQETFLFSESIADNITYGVGPAEQSAIEGVSEIAQLKKDIGAFPHTYETMIGERGITLSGGQKQRVSIARALMRDPAILILDDALSAVDTYTEEEILRGLKKVMENRTSIIISHRISTVKNADLIVVMDNGEIVERGTHAELVELDGIYADLHYKQLLEEELDHLD